MKYTSVMLMSRSQGKTKGIPGARLWCQVAAGYQLPASVQPGTVLADPVGHPDCWKEKRKIHILSK